MKYFNTDYLSHGVDFYYYLQLSLRPLCLLLVVLLSADSHFNDERSYHAV